MKDDFTNKSGNKKVFETKVAGMSFKLRTAHDENTVNELVDFVNGKFEEALQGTKNKSVHNAMVLAALNIAEEFILLKKKANIELDQLLEETQKISSDLELAQGSQEKPGEELEVNQGKLNHSSFANC